MRRRRLMRLRGRFSFILNIRYHATFYAFQYLIRSILSLKMFAENV
jgi:hypothetical protein